MRSKTIELFLAVSLAATMGACNTGSSGGEAGETAPQNQPNQTVPTTGGGEG